MNIPPELPILPEDWEKTPVSVQAVIITLWQEIPKLKAQVEKLQERVNKNSQNSSKPPSSDPPQKRSYPKPELSGEKKGGRKGHHGHGRKLKAAEEVSKIVKSLPTVCKDCDTLLMGEDPQPERHQVSEVPKIKPIVVEYQRHTLDCCLEVYPDTFFIPTERIPFAFSYVSSIFEIVKEPIYFTASISHSHFWMMI